jgi:hypothetical protein
MKTRIVIIALTVLLAGPLAAGLADDGAKYRELLATKSELVVTVKFVLKTEGGLMAMMGRGGAQEQNMEVLGVVVDATGLVMTSSTHLGRSFTRSIMGRQIQQRSTASDFKILFGNEPDEYEAVQAAKDSKLNLAFVQIKDLKGRKIKALDLSDTPDPLVGQQIVSVVRFGRGFDFAPYFSLARISGEVKMPRKMWPITGGIAAVGLPIYDVGGKTLGVLTSQAGSEGAGGRGGGLGDIMSLLGGGGGNAGIFIIPVAKVKKVVTQAQDEAQKALAKAKEEEKKAEEGDEGEEEGDEEEDEEEGDEEDDGYLRAEESGAKSGK